MGDISLYIVSIALLLLPKTFESVIVFASLGIRDRMLAGDRICSEIIILEKTG